MNSNPEALWDIRSFETVLAHEIGHALGLHDVDLSSGPGGLFIDDNYDGTDGATAAHTLTNSFAGLIDPFDPAASPLGLFIVANGDPGFDSFGADILMESAIPPGLYSNPNIKLQNDDFAGRQFLYPFVVPEPGTALLVAGGLLGLAVRRRGRPSGAGDRS